MSKMKSISPYQLWKFLTEEDQKNVSCRDGEYDYVDFRLGVFLETHGLKLKSIFITNDIETYRNIDDVHYLKAHVEMTDEKGDDIVMDIRPYYSGDDDEWALLMMDKQVDDIDIRFTMEVYKTEPLWIAAIEGEKRTPLTGDKMQWSMMQYIDAKESFENTQMDFAPSTCIIDDELDDLTAEAFDPDFDINDSDYNNWRNY